MKDKPLSFNSLFICKSTNLHIHEYSLKHFDKIHKKIGSILKTKTIASCIFVSMTKILTSTSEITQLFT